MRATTWDRLVREVANKQGAVHSDVHVPNALDDLADVGVADLDAVASASATWL